MNRFKLPADIEAARYSTIQAVLWAHRLNLAIQYACDFWVAEGEAEAEPGYTESLEMLERAREIHDFTTAILIECKANTGTNDREKAEWAAIVTGERLRPGQWFSGADWATFSGRCQLPLDSDGPPTCSRTRGPRHHVPNRQVRGTR